MRDHILALFFRKSEKSANTVAIFRKVSYNKVQGKPAIAETKRLAAQGETQPSLKGDRYHEIQGRTERPSE